MNAVTSAAKVTRLQDNVFLIPGRKGGGCNVYILKGTHKNVLIDVGLPSEFDVIQAGLSEVGLRVDDINMLLLTHEHIDHMGGASHFPERTIVAAHAKAANKISLHDEFVIMSKAFNSQARPLHVDIHLDHGTVIDLGTLRLRTIHTPGHCSGAVCFYEPNRQALFTADTLFAGGTLGGIFASGNLSDYIASLESLRDLRLSYLYPGHGHMSSSPALDIERAIQGSVGLLHDTRNLFDTISDIGTFNQLVKSTAAYSRRAADRRQYGRESCDYTAILHVSGKMHECGVVNLSPGGALLDLDVTLADGTTVTVHIDGEELVQGRVVASEPGATRVCFDPKDESHNKIGALLNKRRS
jgi:glyoxylase-like metal-dependent hydrolase (beta-lactamase superfamily II)